MSLYRPVNERVCYQHIYNLIVEYQKRRSSKVGTELICNVLYLFKKELYIAGRRGYYDDMLQELAVQIIQAAEHFDTEKYNFKSVHHFFLFRKMDAVTEVEKLRTPIHTFMSRRRYDMLHEGAKMPLFEEVLYHSSQISINDTFTTADGYEVSNSVLNHDNMICYDTPLTELQKKQRDDIFQVATSELNDKEKEVLELILVGGEIAGEAERILGFRKGSNGSTYIKSIKRKMRRTLEKNHITVNEIKE